MKFRVGDRVEGLNENSKEWLRIKGSDVITSIHASSRGVFIRVNNENSGRREIGSNY